MAREGAKIAIVYLEEHKDADGDASRWSRTKAATRITIAGDVGDESILQAGGRDRP